MLGTTGSSGPKTPYRDGTGLLQSAKRESQTDSKAYGHGLILHVQIFFPYGKQGKSGCIFPLISMSSEHCLCRAGAKPKPKDTVPVWEVKWRFSEDGPSSPEYTYVGVPVAWERPGSPGQWECRGRREESGTGEESMGDTDNWVITEERRVRKSDPWFHRGPLGTPSATSTPCSTSSLHLPIPHSTFTPHSHSGCPTPKGKQKRQEDLKEK